MKKLKRLIFLLALPLFFLPSQGLAEEIDILMTYTSAARTALGGEAALSKEIDAMIHEVNIVLSNSRLEHRLRLVGRYKVDFSESGSAQVDLNRVATDFDVAAERDRVSADIVCLITSHSDSNGMGFAYSDDPALGFCMIKIHPDYAFLGMTRGFLMAHEVGHLFGCNHNDDAVLQAGSGTGQGYQYWVDLIPYGTVMAYPSWETLLHNFTWYYSNPDIMHYSIWGYGVPRGVAGEHDCAGMINSTAGTVAAYRTRQLLGDTVWVDTSLADSGFGSEQSPFNTVEAGIDNVPEEGKLIFKGGTAGWQGSQYWQGTIGKAMTISAKGGSMTIGQ